MFLKRDCATAGNVGGIEQTIETVPNARYRVQFKFTGSLDSSNNDVVKLVVATDAGENLLTKIHTAKGSLETGSWNMLTEEFYASSSRSRLQIWAESEQCIYH